VLLNAANHKTLYSQRSQPASRLNQSDGGHSLLDIAERSGLPFSAIGDAAELLSQNGLLSEVSGG